MSIISTSTNIKAAKMERFKRQLKAAGHKPSDLKQFAEARKVMSGTPIN